MAESATMRAIAIREYGGSDRLREERVPCPDAGPGEVLVRVAAAGVNPVDWKTRRGDGVAGMLGDDSFPLILGWDISGEVVAVGTGVTTLAAGDAVFGMVNFPGIGAAYAEYVAGPTNHLARKPANITHEDAAGLPLVSLTAWQALFEAGGLQPRQSVLIHAAAGGVGSMAVQLAVWRGARVIGTASARNHDLVRELGAAEVIDYREGRLEDAVHDLDMVLDTVGGEAHDRSYALLRRGGTLVSLGQIDQERADAAGVRATGILVGTNAEQIREIARLVGEGAIRPVTGTVLPLSEVREAHELSESGRARGKIVLRMGRQA